MPERNSTGRRKYITRSSSRALAKQPHHPAFCWVWGFGGLHRNNIIVDVSNGRSRRSLVVTVDERRKARILCGMYSPAKHIPSLCASLILVAWNASALGQEV